MKIDGLFLHSQLNQIRFEKKQLKIGLKTNLECSKYFGFWIDHWLCIEMLKHNKSNNGKTSK